MKAVYYTSDSDLLTALRSGIHIERDRALKQLLLDPVVNGKIRDLLNQYNLKHLQSDDILQEGLILLDDLVRSFKFRGDSTVRSYLIGICKNLMRADMGRVKRVVLTDTDADMDGKDDASADARLVLLEKTEEENQREAVLKSLLAQITEGCQQTIHLYYYKAFSTAQVAAERGLANANQAKKALDRCRKQLRDLISEKPSLAAFLKGS
jgi:RNA polymerase sigma factor (sigma-70 family)